MKKHELLKYAYDNYPKGTKFKSPSIHKTEIISTGQFRLNENNDVLLDDEKGTYVKYSNSSGWAEIVTDRKPLVKTNDGVFLFEGDYVACVFLNDGKWELGKEYNWILSNTVTQSCQDQCSDTRALFSTKQAALDWIEKMNKPKEIEVKLINGSSALVTKSQVNFENSRYHLIKSEIEDISHALKTLNNE